MSNCEVKICDLGFARWIREQELSYSFDSGNLAFAAPEKLLREGYDKRTDVWSIGQLFYFCMTGLYMFNSMLQPGQEIHDIKDL